MVPWVVDAGALLIADGRKRGAIVRRFKLLRINEPEIVRVHPRHLLGEPGTVDQPPAGDKSRPRWWEATDYAHLIASRRSV